MGSDSFCSSFQLTYGKYAITEMYALNKAGLTEMEVILAAATKWSRDVKGR